MKNNLFKNIELTELHVHVGSSVSPNDLWEIAHSQGLQLPTKDYWEFSQMVTIHEKKGYEEYLKMYDLLEKIQSSPEAIFQATQTAIAGAYKKNNVAKLELRFNPILRCRQGEMDLDHIIVYALHGMERAMLKYPVKCGLILSLDRRFSEEENAGIVKKAIKYKKRGIVGVDLAGPTQLNDNSKSFKPQSIAHLIIKAKKAGLGITIHTGEATDCKEMWEVVNNLKPDRIGHGVACVNDTKLMKHLSKKGIVLETCPSSNLNTKTIKDLKQLAEVYKKLLKNNVLFTINTDGPELQRTTLIHEYELLLTNNILTRKELLTSNKVASEASFII